MQLQTHQSSVICVILSVYHQHLDIEATELIYINSIADQQLVECISSFIIQHEIVKTSMIERFLHTCRYVLLRHYLSSFIYFDTKLESLTVFARNSKYKMNHHHHLIPPPRSVVS